jgi:hypothetical protein
LGNGGIVGRGAYKTPPPDAGAAKVKFKFAESRRNKKSEEKRKIFKELFIT